MTGYNDNEDNGGIVLTHDGKMHIWGGAYAEAGAAMGLG